MDVQICIVKVVVPLMLSTISTQGPREIFRVCEGLNREANGGKVGYVDHQLGTNNIAMVIYGHIINQSISI